MVIQVLPFSKIYGLAGLRIGFGVADAQIIDLLNRVRQPFNINSLALAAAEAALGDGDHVSSSRRENKQGMSTLAAGFAALDCRFGAERVSRIGDQRDVQHAGSGERHHTDYRRLDCG